MLEDLGRMVDECRKVRSTNDLSIIVSVDGAINLMRDVFYTRNKKVDFTDDVDELFAYDGVPVRLRVRAHPGIATMAKTADLPPRSCCDATAVTTMVMTMSKVQA